MQALNFQPEYGTISNDGVYTPQLEALTGECVGTIHPQGVEYLKSLFNGPRKIVITMSADGMKPWRALDPKVLINFEIEGDNEKSMRQCKIVRRDWKHHKVYLMEVQE